MEKTLGNNGRLLCYFAAGLICVAMVAVSEFFNEPEIIFPEIEALLIGMLIAERPVWNVNKKLFVFIMAASATAGLWISSYRFTLMRFMGVEYLDCWCDRLTLLAAICMAYAFSGIILDLCSCLLLPAVSACVLPVLTNVHSWIYPLSVLVIALVVAAASAVAERAGLISGAEVKTASLSGGEAGAEAAGAADKRTLRISGIGASAATISDGEAEDAAAAISDKHRAERIKWLACFPAVLAIGGAAILSGFKFAIAPPLIVVLLTFAGASSPLRENSLKIYLLITACASVGAASVFLIYLQLQLPMTASVSLTVLIISVLFYHSKLLFPPAGALAILPSILPEASVPFYPLMIAFGAAAFILSGNFISDRLSRI